MEARAIPWSSPLWTPSPETKLRLQDLQTQELIVDDSGTLAVLEPGLVTFLLWTML